MSPPLRGRLAVLCDGATRCYERQLVQHARPVLTGGGDFAQRFEPGDCSLVKLVSDDGPGLGHGAGRVAFRPWQRGWPGCESSSLE